MKKIMRSLFSLILLLSISYGAKAIDVNLIGFKSGKIIDKECIAKQLENLLSTDIECLKKICWGTVSPTISSSMKDDKLAKININDNLYIYIDFYMANMFFLSNKNSLDGIYCYGKSKDLNLISCIK